VLKQKTDHQVSGKGNRFVDSPLFYHESVYFSDGCVIITSSIKQEVNMAELSKEQKREIVCNSKILQILAEIEELEREIEASSAAWDDGTDPFAMAACDPSDQFMKGERISQLIRELKMEKDKSSEVNV
jgi:hypothetical protein